jgi:hypothetical protein
VSRNPKTSSDRDQNLSIVTKTELFVTKMGLFVTKMGLFVIVMKAMPNYLADTGKLLNRLRRGARQSLTADGLRTHLSLSMRRRSTAERGTDHSRFFSNARLRIQKP